MTNNVYFSATGSIYAGATPTSINDSLLPVVSPTLLTIANSGSIAAAAALVEVAHAVEKGGSNGKTPDKTTARNDFSATI